MKIEKKIVYNIVTLKGAKLEISEAELVQLFNQLKQIVEPIVRGGKYLYVGTMTMTHPPHVDEIKPKVGWPINPSPTAIYTDGEY